MTHNGVEIVSMSCNGQEVKSWIHNGVSLLSKVPDVEPFYWIKSKTVQSGFPSTFNINSYSPSNLYYRNSLNDFYCSCGTISTSGGSLSGSTSAVETKGHKYMKITAVLGITNGSGYFLINDTNNTKITSSGTYIIDVSDVDSISISAYLSTNALSATYSHISDIYFYS